jgi:hypothetical protein
MSERSDDNYISLKMLRILEYHTYSEEMDKQKKDLPAHANRRLWKFKRQNWSEWVTLKSAYE